MMHTTSYRGHYIHCTEPDSRYPLSAQARGKVCRIQAPNGDLVDKSRSVEGAKKKIRARLRRGR